MNLWKGPGIDAASLIRRIADQAGRPLTFVQIGSNDGSMGDPLHEVVKKRHWRGVLVEPLPHLFAALQANYRGVPGVTFEQSAVGAVDGMAVMYSLVRRPGDPVWAGGLGSFSRETMLEAAAEIPDIAERIEEVEVPVVRLETLLDKHHIATIDLLQIDTEGYDYEILRQVDFSASWAPNYIIYESCHLDPPTLVEAHAMLASAGYKVLEAGYDDFAYRS